MGIIINVSYFGRLYMRRILVAVASVFMAIMMSITAIGCNLVTVNNEKDMNQVVAEVSIGEGAPVEKIYKKDMVMAYINYYYTLEQQGTSRADVFQTIIENLVNNRVFVQYAIKYFSGDAAEINWDIATYLDDIEKRDAKYSAYKDMNELIESYETDNKDGDKVGDTVTTTVRAVPTGATNDDELSDKEKDDYIAKGIDTTSTDQKKKAFAKVVNILQVNDLLGDGYDGSDITTTDYYKETLNNYYESLLIEKFEKDITNKARKQVITDAQGNITLAKLEAEYAKLVQKQKDYDATEFANALSSVSASSPIVWSEYSGYGLVYNLLLGADTTLTDKLTEWKEDNPNYTQAAYEEAREDIFADIKIKDLRSSWITAGYDFDADTKKFTGDYTLTTDSLAYQGTVTKLTEDGAEKPEYRAEADEMSISEFLNFMEKYLYGAENAVTQANANITDNYEVKAPTVNDPSEFENKVKELMFAFSTDDSDAALNTYKGYDITPKPNGNGSEKYMIEFANAGRKLIDENNGFGEYGYIMVATDYGYHVMFVSEIFDTDYQYETLKEYLDKEYGAPTESWEKELEKMFENWDDADTNHYLYVLFNNLASTAVNNALSEKQKEILNTYVYAGDYVTLYESAYADLME